MKKKLKILLLTGIVYIAAFFIGNVPVWAAQADVTFDEQEYASQPGENFKVRVRISSQENVNTYHVEIRYDSTKLEYVSGGEENNGDFVVLEGTALGTQVVYELEFKALSAAETGLNVANVQINSMDSIMEFKAVNYVPVHVVDAGGNAVVSNSAYSVPVIGQAAAGDGKVYYIVDLSQYIPEAADWKYDLTKRNFNNNEATFLTDTNGTVNFMYLMDGSLNFYLYAYDSSDGKMYPCYAFESVDEKIYYMSPDIVKVWPDNLSLSIVNSKNIVYGMKLNGLCDYYEMDNDKLTPWVSDDYSVQESIKLTVILVIAVVALIIVMRLALISTHQKHRRKRRKKAGRNKKSGKKNKTLPMKSGGKLIASRKNENDDFIEFIDLLEENEKPDGYVEAKEEDYGDRELVVAVKDVTMHFKISDTSSSGVKEYVINRMKKKTTYRDLFALNHVSFNVYKGEIVGIIGSNGSGKSTLLRIISGALKPTAGMVDVDFRKVQLLTLGTGFDMELTARENIYLNGAVIGYSQEFIDKHYDEIVEFAELENFMDEKVRNFSSGMVSRLAFAIATIGRTAEILILDEVLSVGDEAFRRKSLERVNEMIHSGATVFMVSHSLATIMENCTKAIWLEKGKILSIGDTKTVCDAYKKSIDNEYTGLIRKNNVWLYYRKGKPDYRYTGLVRNNFGWWYVKNGKIDFNFTGLITNQHGTWYLKNGKIDINFSGEYDDNGVKVIVRGGKVVE